MADIGKDFDNLDLPLDNPDGERLDLEQNDSIGGLAGALGLDDLDLSMEGEETFSLDINDGSDITLDFGSEDETLDTSTLLQTESDISKTLLDYANYVTNARQKIMSTAHPQKTAQVMPPFSDFRFIANETEQRMVYGFFCSMLNDLVTLDEYKDLTEEQAFDVLLEMMFREIHFTPNVYRSKLHRIFQSVYLNNKRIAMAQAVIPMESLVNLVDLKRVELAELVYTVNSVPFNVVTRYFADPYVVNPRAAIKVTDYGDLAQLIKERKSNGTILHKDVFNFIAEFLTSDETLGILKLTPEQGIEFGLGELLRRYVLQELNDGDFFPSGMEKLSFTTFDKNFVLLSQLYKSLVMAIQRQSFAAELLCLILELMNGTANGPSEDSTFLNGYTVGIAKYLSTFVKDKALVNPTFYSYIGEAKSDSDTIMFELGYVQGDQSFTVDSLDILCEVVGDNNNIYHIPLVYLDSKTQGVLCPPVEVVEGVRKLAPSGKMSVGGGICYRFEPTFAWLSTLTLASSSALQEDKGAEEGISQSNNPLLDVLLHYTNKFDTSGNQPHPVKIDAPGKCSVLGISKQGSDLIKICQFLNPSGRQLTLESGTCLLDDDGGLVIRYVESSQTGEQIILLNPGEYDETVIDKQDKGTVEGLPILHDVIVGYTDEIGKSYPGLESYYKVIASRICELNALDYEAEKTLARKVIVRDLSTVLNIGCLDQLFGAALTLFFVEQFKSTDIGSFNFGVLKELWNFTYGVPNSLSDKTELSKEELHQFYGEVKNFAERDVSISEFASKLDALPMHILALQACSRSEVQHTASYDLYDALHFIPAFNQRLSALENQMVMIHALREIDDDIIGVLRKNSPTFSCYNTVTTKDTVERVEANLKSGMKAKSDTRCLEATSAVLNSDLAENYVILKYFILERNLYGILTELEECFSKHDLRYKSLYDSVQELAGDAIPHTDLRSISEEEFRANLTREVMDKIFLTLHDQFISVVLNGLIAEASREIPIQILKAYDIFTTYGSQIFNLRTDVMEDFEKTDAYKKAFYGYLGSFYLTYCPVIGEAADEIDGGYDRYTAYLRNRKDFKTPFMLQTLEEFKLQDLKLVTGLESGETLAARSGSDDAEPEDF